MEKKKAAAAMCGIKEEQALQADEARSIKALRLERACYVRRPG